MPEIRYSSDQQSFINLPISHEVCFLIDRAASVRGQDRSGFILSAAQAAAEETLLDQFQISVSPEAYAEFLRRLDLPPEPNQRLRKTMSQPLPWKNT